MSEFRDISLPLTEALVVYPGDPEISIRPHSRIADGDDANVTRLAFGSHTGTHLDAARHFMDDGQTVDRLPLARLIGPARVVRIPDEVMAIGAGDLRRAGVVAAAPDAGAGAEPGAEPGARSGAVGNASGTSRLLLRTRNSGLPATGPFRKDFAYLTGDAARFLLEAGVELVGIDYLSVEAPDADDPVVHRVLLEREVVIVEGLDLRDVAPGLYELICLPLRLEGLDGSPVRAVLRDLSANGPDVS
jgi:arylformamidase